MWFFKLTIDAIVTLCVAKWGQEIGGLCYETVRGMLDYVWFDAQNEYFLDFPDDHDTENTIPNIVKRIGKTLRK